MNNKHCVWPGASGHLHTGVESRFTIKVIHDDAVVTVDDMLVNALPAEMFQYFINAVDAIQNSLEKKQNIALQSSYFHFKPRSHFIYTDVYFCNVGELL